MNRRYFALLTITVTLTLTLTLTLAFIPAPSADPGTHSPSPTRSLKMTASERSQMAYVIRSHGYTCQECTWCMAISTTNRGGVVFRATCDGDRWAYRVTTISDRDGGGATVEPW